MDDATDLVVRAQGGDRQALGELLAGHLPLVHGVVARGLGDDGSCAADVDDVVQETMLRVVTSLDGLRDPSRFRSWLVAIAYRQMQEHRRARGARPVPADPTLARLALDAPALDDRATAAVVAADQRHDIVAAGQWLDPAQQGVLGLWWSETRGELGRGDLARALGVGRRHAAVRVQRMRSQLATAREVVTALQAVSRCSGLDAAAEGWDGTPSSLWRKRLHKHVRGCPDCSGKVADLVPPEQLVLGAGTLAVPAALVASVDGWAAGGAGAGHGVTEAVAGPWWHGWTDLLRDGWDVVVARPVAAIAVTAVAVGGGGVAVTTLVPDDEPRPAQVASPSPSPSPSAVALPASDEPTEPTEPTEPPAAGSTRGVVTADLYVAPDGSDSADGTYAHPFATLARAVEAVRPGQTIALRGGTHPVTEPVRIDTDGERGARITLSGYRDESAVVDLSAVAADEWPLVQEADRWTVRDLEIRGSRSHGYLCVSCRSSVFERLRVHDNTRSGMELRGEGTVDNVVRDSEFFRNHDDSAGGAAGLGFGVKFGSGEGNLVEGNVFSENADDGVDLGGFTSPVTLRDNVAVGNGVNRWDVPEWHGNGGGFTLGGGGDVLVVAHVLEGNVARGNGHHGFADGGNLGAIRFVGNVAEDNGGAGYYLVDAAAVLVGNAAGGNDVPAKLGDGVVDDGSFS